MAINPAKAIQARAQQNTINPLKAQADNQRAATDPTGTAQPRNPEPVPYQPPSDDWLIENKGYPTFPTDQPFDALGLPGGLTGGSQGSGSGGGGYTPSTFTYEGALHPGAYNAPGLALGTWQTPEAYKPIDDFVEPTTADLANDAGYQHRIKAGEDAIQRSAAARGTLLTGGTLQDLETFAQDYASGELKELRDKRWTQYLHQYEANLRENELLWNRALTKYQTDVDAQFKNWQSAFQGYDSWYNNERRNLEMEYQHARQGWADQENAAASAAAAADAERRREEEFLNNIAFGEWY